MVNRRLHWQEPSPPISWDIYLARHTPAKWIGTVEAVDGINGESGPCAHPVDSHAPRFGNPANLHMTTAERRLRASAMNLNARQADIDLAINIAPLLRIP